MGAFSATLPVGLRSVESRKALDLHSIMIASSEFRPMTAAAVQVERCPVADVDRFAHRWKRAR